MNGNDMVLTIVTAIAGILVGGVLGYLFKQYLSESRRKSAQSEAQRLVEEAQAQAREIELAARDQALKLRDEVESESRRQRRDFQKEEQRLQKRREMLDNRLEQLETRERKLNQRQSRLDRRQNELDQLHETRTAELERVANMSQEEAQELLLQTVEEDTRQDMARVIREVEAEAHEEAERRANKIIVEAIQRTGTDQVSEVTVSMIPLPSDEMKGRIIGRGGRNIRAFEQATGVDVVVDDTPEAIVLSCFDSVRREVARVAMDKLILDGRIHPGRIENVVAKAQEEVRAVIREAGEQAAIEVGVPGLHAEIIKLLGRLKFRTSYGQNQLLHAVETARLAGLLASELKANVQVAKAGALLHDLGKAVDYEMEGPHALIGADLARRYGVNEATVNCIAGHHHEEEQQSLEAIIVEIADAISGARPGARRESVETYIKRVKALEEVADSFQGVDQSYAIQAGREIRIIVRPDDVDDLAAIRLSKDIARKVEEMLQFPGQIKVTVIRETRAVDYAK
jgi:ribonuclease Y